MIKKWISLIIVPSEKALGPQRWHYILARPSWPPHKRLNQKIQFSNTFWVPQYQDMCYIGPASHCRESKIFMARLGAINLSTFHSCW